MLFNGRKNANLTSSVFPGVSAPSFGAHFVPSAHTLSTRRVTLAQPYTGLRAGPGLPPSQCSYPLSGLIFFEVLDACIFHIRFRPRQ